MGASLPLKIGRSAVIDICPPQPWTREDMSPRTMRLQCEWRQMLVVLPLGHVTDKACDAKLCELTESWALDRAEIDARDQRNMVPTLAPVVQLRKTN